MSFHRDWFYPPYVSVAEQKRRNAEVTKKLNAKDQALKPVCIVGSKIAKTFWGKAWCDNVESYQDYSNRLPRGRSYVRYGAVIDLQIFAGQVTAQVVGSASKPYQITIAIAPLAKPRWEELKRKCVGRIDSLLALVQGKMPPEILQEFCSQSQGLFPSPRDIAMRCNCPDSAGLCKHLAAVLYGIGARLDEDPKLFFTLRGLDERELIGDEAVASLTEGAAEIAAPNLADVFGVEFDALEDVQPTRAAAPPRPQPPAATTPQTTTPRPPAATTPQTTAWTPEMVRKLRQRLAMTQSAFARLVGVTAPLISALENGKTPVSVTMRQRLDKLAAEHPAQTAPAPAAAVQTSPAPSSSGAPVREASPRQLQPLAKSMCQAWTPAAIRELRSRLRMTQKQFASHLGTSSTAISFLENGKAKITSPLMRQLDALAGKPLAPPATAANSKTATTLSVRGQAARPPETISADPPRSHAKRRKPATNWTPAAIARLRKRLGLSPAAFAQLAGVGIATIRNWERGMTHPTPAAKSRLSALEP